MKRAGLPVQAPRAVGDALARQRNSSSLVITRTLSKALGTQTHVPSRYLAGIVPEALLDRYTFWQSEGVRGVLTGYEQSRGADEGTIVKIALDSAAVATKIGAAELDGAGSFGNREVGATVVREPILSHTEPALADPDPSVRQGNAAALPALARPRSFPSFSVTFYLSTAHIPATPIETRQPS